jgi:hypothetical protein
MKVFWDLGMDLGYDIHALPPCNVDKQLKSKINTNSQKTYLDLCFLKIDVGFGTLFLFM